MTVAEFLVALGAFLASHLIPTRPPVRPWLTRHLGEWGYLALYSAVSLALFWWLALAALRAPYVPLWAPPLWTYWLPVLVMPFAFMLISAGLIEPNPLSVSLAKAPLTPERPGIISLTRHPVLWGFGLWGLAHIPPNGALVPVILFGGFTLFAFAGMLLVDRKRRRTLGPDAWRALDASRRLFPGGSSQAGSIRALFTPRTLAGMATGLLLYLLFLVWAHRALFGIDPLAFV